MGLAGGCLLLQLPQTSSPHVRQWWRRFVVVNLEEHERHTFEDLSGVQSSRSSLGTLDMLMLRRSLRLDRFMSAGDGTGALPSLSMNEGGCFCFQIASCVAASEMWSWAAPLSTFSSSEDVIVALLR